jgi:hypothetical protein
MNFTLYAALWALVGLATGGLALYRKLISMSEEDYVHLAPGTEGIAAKQAALAGRLNSIDRWGVTLTVITAVAGAVLGAAYLYMGWVGSSR